NMTSVPNVVGQSMDAAESRLQSSGLMPEWMAGPPAPSKQLEGTVAKQSLVVGEEVEPGTTMALEIYTEMIPELVLPDLVGMPLDQAEQNLVELNLNPALEVGDPAPNQELQYAVQSQNPAAGETVIEGDAITLKLYSEFIPNLKMPDLLGKRLDLAERQLQEMGMGIEFQVGDPALSAAQNGTVQGQTPEAGETIIPGQSVSLVIHSDYIPPPMVRVPNLVGKSLHSIGAVLSGVGLQGKWRKGDPAPNSSLENTVALQTPAAGTEIEEGGTVIVDVYQAALEQDLPNPLPVSSGGGSSSERAESSSGGGRQRDYLPPVLKLVVPETVKGIALNTGKAVTTRAEYKGWKPGDEMKHRMFMVGYGTGDPWGNFFDDNPEDVTHFMVVAAWLEKGDTFDGNDNIRPNPQPIVETRTGGDYFLNEEDDAIAYFYSANMPASVTIVVDKRKLNTFSKSFCKSYAMEIFKQLAGGEVDQPVKNQGPASRISQIRLPENTGSIAKLPLSSGPTTVRKDQSEWWNSDKSYRHVNFSFNRPGKVDNFYNGKVDMELSWLESSDPVSSSAQTHFKTLTAWNPPRQRGMAGMTRLHEDPLYFHSKSHMVRLKITSNHGLLHHFYYDLEKFAIDLMKQIESNAMRRPTRYTPFRDFRFSRRFQELVAGGSIENFRPREQAREWYGTSITKPNGGAWGFPHRTVHINYWSGNKNTGTATGHGVYGIPSGGDFRFAKNATVDIYLYWVEEGDPYHAEMRDAFSGRRGVVEDRRYADIGDIDYYFFSNRLAAIVKVSVDYDQGMPTNYPARKQEAQRWAQDFFRQLEGHALSLEDLPNQPLMK
ncbi:MAG: PASTA domain-containing protein, partial [Opitutales bacterium]|nr:PASTA domain-containing protein [Opitutales bacterium]